MKLTWRTIVSNKNQSSSGSTVAMWFHYWVRNPDQQNHYKNTVCSLSLCLFHLQHVLSAWTFIFTAQEHTRIPVEHWAWQEGDFFFFFLAWFPWRPCITCATVPMVMVTRVHYDQEMMTDLRWGAEPRHWQPLVSEDMGTSWSLTYVQVSSRTSKKEDDTKTDVRGTTV